MIYITKHARNRYAERYSVEGFPSLQEVLDTIPPACFLYFVPKVQKSTGYIFTWRNVRLCFIWQPGYQRYVLKTVLPPFNLSKRRFTRG